MDYEKKYKEALERAKVIYQGSYKPDTAATIAETLQNVFPELCESEGERIRKELIEYIKDQQSSFISAPDCRDKYEEEENNKYNSWIAWLEKQGKEDSFIQQAYEQGYTEGKRIERKHWIEKQNFSEDYNSIDPQFGKPIEQNPAEWSEEDEVKINRIVACLENLNVADNDILLKDVDWLKSLKQRIGWKPSDEQMEALFVLLPTVSYGRNPAFSLYNDLKKLKGE